MNNDIAETDGGAGYDFSANMDSGADIGSGMSLQASDGEYLPIVKVQAAYPRRALQRGIEGYVVVEFTVTKQGSVRDLSWSKLTPKEFSIRPRWMPY